MLVLKHKIDIRTYTSLYFITVGLRHCWRNVHRGRNSGFLHLHGGGSLQEAGDWKAELISAIRRSELTLSSQWEVNSRRISTGACWTRITHCTLRLGKKLMGLYFKKCMRGKAHGTIFYEVYECLMLEQFKQYIVSFNIYGASRLLYYISVIKSPMVCLWVWIFKHLSW